MQKRRTTNLIVIHCSATRPSQNIGVKEIDQWHRNPPNKWVMIGYHFVIRRDGTVEIGRPVDCIGAHVYPPAGINSRSVSICLIGGVKESDGKTPENNFTPEQWVSLNSLVDQMLIKYPNAEVDGHGNISKDRACPSFNVKEWLRTRKPSTHSDVISKAKPVQVRPVLKRGDKGDTVKDLQRFLKMAKNDIDGIFGPMTDSYVKAFQLANKLTVDGIVGPKTWQKLTE